MLVLDKPLTHCKRGHELTPENVYVNSGKGTRQCRKCKREANRAWRHGEKISIPNTHCRRGHLLTPQNSYLQSNGGRSCAICQKERQTSQYLQSGLRFKRHGITEQDFLNIIEKQNGCCPICGNALDIKQAVIDHDHTTNRVRGLLCVNCNTGLGKLGDSVSSLIKAVRYLNDHSH